MLTVILITSVIAELLIYVTPPFWRVRRYAVGIPLVLTAFATTGLVFASTHPWTLLLAYVAVFRIINMLRVAEDRMHEAYLRRAVRRTGVVLGGMYIGLALLPALEVHDFLAVFVGLQLVTALFVLAVTLRNLQRSRHRHVLENYADRELPTVTVAIPARNETAELEDCLRSILANNYPKFEVLVLDDCSHDRTPDVIREFANDGVRFVTGDEPGERWLAKNQAYDKLADEADGELILFCGVDVRFGPETIRSLVTTMLARKKDMVSIMPRRLSSDFSAAFIQPMRYWWELALPRRYFNRPPILSTCWLIRRKTLKKLGGFEAVQHAILPEGYFARELVKTDGYSFIRADDVLDVQTRKGMVDQRETATRVRYPQVRRRPEVAMVIMLAELTLLLGPFVVVLSALWGGFGLLQAVAASAALLLILTHVTIVQVSDPANVLIAALNYPAVVITEIIVGIVSMYRYEFSVVDWKGRNICLPVMHVTPKLPDIK